MSADTDAWNDPAYESFLAANFSSVTPEMQMKWRVTEPTRGTFDWTAADRMVAQARSRGQVVRGHTLLWHGALPDWVVGAIHTCADARALLHAHIQDEAGHFAGRIAQWDVANEVFDVDGRPRAENPFIRACGLDIVADAFRWTHETDPIAKLYLNDDGQLGGGARANAQYALVKSLVNRGVPIDGVGFQAHLDLKGVPNDAGSQLQRYAALGLDVAITEADVRIEASHTPSAGQLRQQAAVYRELLSTCLHQVRCTSFTVWGFSDSWSWVPAALPGQGWACVLDAELRPKPAWAALRGELRSV